MAVQKKLRSAEKSSRDIFPSSQSVNNEFETGKAQAYTTLYTFGIYDYNYCIGTIKIMNYNYRCMVHGYQSITSHAMKAVCVSQLSVYPSCMCIPVVFVSQLCLCTPVVCVFLFCQFRNRCPTDVFTETDDRQRRSFR